MSLSSNSEVYILHNTDSFVSFQYRLSLLSVRFISVHLIGYTSTGCMSMHSINLFKQHILVNFTVHFFYILYKCYRFFVYNAIEVFIYFFFLICSIFYYFVSVLLSLNHFWAYFSPLCNRPNKTLPNGKFRSPQGIFPNPFPSAFANFPQQNFLLSNGKIASPTDQKYKDV